MVEAIYNMITELGLPKTQIKQEDFLGYEWTSRGIMLAIDIKRDL
jgi:hypothetical protein